MAHHQFNNLVDKQIISDWLAAHNRNLSEKDAQTLELLCNNLNYTNLSIESRETGENIIIIPIHEVVIRHFNFSKPYLKLHENSLLNLIIIQSAKGKLRWSSIISFFAADGKKRTKLLAHTIANMFNQKPVLEEGMFRFLDLNGGLACQLSFKGGSINSLGSLVTGDQRPKRKRFVLRNIEEELKDCYLVTTYHGEDFGKPLDEEYLYRRSEHDELGNGEMEEENDLAFEFTEEYVSYSDEELFSDENDGYEDDTVRVKVSFLVLEPEEMELMRAAIMAILDRFIKNQSVITVRSFTKTRFAFYVPASYKSAVEKITTELMRADLGITSIGCSGPITRSTTFGPDLG